MITGAQLTAAFEYLDYYGSRRRTAEVFIELENSESLTVRAGGSGVRSAPAGVPGPYASYEVLLDHEPARFWKRYGSEDGGVLYAEVPRLLITHHVVRRGGIRNVTCEVKEAREGRFIMEVVATERESTDIWESLGIRGIVRIGAQFTMQE